MGRAANNGFRAAGLPRSTVSATCKSRPSGSSVIVVVFTDLSADRAKGLFDDVLKQLAVPSYEEDGILFGPFYEGNKGTAIYNSGFRPFQSPVPFLFVRHGVISDWKFFLDNDDWLNRWAHRYGESAVRALAEELRGLPWRARGDVSHNK
jgi:hypothetical protein